MVLRLSELPENMPNMDRRIKGEMAVKRHRFCMHCVPFISFAVHISRDSLVSRTGVEIETQ